MTNGNGLRRIVIRRVVAVAGALVLAALVLPTPPAAAIVPDTPLAGARLVRLTSTPPA